MTEPVWLDEPAILALHAEGVRIYGGPQGVRDAGLLSSALQRAPNRWAYEGVDDLPELAATYAVAISGNHPFIDGNKRAAFLTLVLFLRRNGRTLAVSNDDAVRTILAVAAGECDIARLADWVRRNSSAD